MKLQKIIEVVDSLKQTYGSGEPPSRLWDELQLLIPEFIEELFMAGQVADVENRVTEARKFDLETLKKGLEIFIKADLLPFTNKSSGKEFDPKIILSKIQEHVKIIEDKEQKFGPLEIATRLELFLDSDFDYLLMACEGKEETISAIEVLVLEKLRSLKEHEILLLWARFKGLFEGERWTGTFKKFEDIIPKSFWEPSSVDEILKKCASFVVRYRPQTIRKMLDEGVQGYRTGPAGLAKILSFRKSAVTVSNLDFLVVRAITELVVLNEHLTYTEHDNLARSIGKNPTGIIFSGDFYDTAKKEIGGGSRNQRHLDILLTTMKKATNYIDIASRVPANVEEQLWRYKLGQEVIAPQNTSKIITGRTAELDLQKDICKFLLEKGVRSFGKTFGRSQIDLYANELPGDDIVIEVKVYKKPPSERGLKANFTQLLSYMDQELQRQPRGALVIFNCSEALLMAPRKWIHDRVFILAINIGMKPPSKRDNWIEIKEGDAPGQIAVVKDGQR